MTHRFQKLALGTTVTTYLLIVVGALVRATGAGMGCPDWPRCFGHWIPPSDVMQVPLALRPFFDVRLMWTEYLNRLLGTTTGLLVFATLVVAILDYRRAPRVLWSSVGAFVGVGVAGWLGKLVVEKNLAPSFVTVHMFIALATVGLLVYATICARTPDGLPPVEEVSPARTRLAWSAVGAASVVAVQIALGTRVRASIEHVARVQPSLPRGAWLAQLGALDHLHRTLALAVLACTAGLAWYAYRVVDPRTGVRRAAIAVLAMSLAQIVAGIGLAYVALPPVLQVTHVGLASLLLGGLEVLALLAWRLPLATGRGASAVAAVAGELSTNAGRVES